MYPIIMDQVPEIIFNPEDMECTFFVCSSSGNVQCTVHKIKREYGMLLYHGKDYKGKQLLFRFEDIHGRGYIPKREFCIKKAEEFGADPVTIGFSMQASMEQQVESLDKEGLMSLDKTYTNDFKG